MNQSIRLACVAVVGGFAASAFGSADYGPAVWRPTCNGKWYTSGYGKKFFVIHDMEGYYLTGLAYLNQCGVQASIHYAVNGKKDTASDANPGEVSQTVIDAYYAWHASCWNQHSMGTEHEGFASNPAWYTAEMYSSSAALTKSKADKYGFAKDRYHIVAHGEESNGAWVNWAGPNLGINPTCNTHTDPGPYWDWNGYMALIQPINPPYLFDSNVQGWTAGNASTSPWWIASGWPGVLVTDQLGNDCFIYGPASSFGGPGEAVINVNLYAQNGNTANHDMQMFWTSAAEPFWDAAKSTPPVNYTAQNGWACFNLDASGNGKFVGQLITQLRLDFDAINHGNRWIVNHIVVQSSLRWRFDTSTMGWTAGNAVAAPWFTDCCGWPGVIVVDQTGNDAFIISGSQYFNSAGPFNYIGGSKDTIHVRVFAQNGNTANHDMQVFWTTSADGSFTESKSKSATFVAQNSWADVYLPVGDNPNWVGGHITNLRLDFDAINHGNRWIIDYVAFEYRP